MKSLVRMSLALVAAVWGMAANSAASPSPQATRPVASRFCKALPGYRFEFPRDHFSHPCFRTEWWYFTGNLSDRNGRRFGFELTFFREGVENHYPNPSRWRVDELYSAHFAISDLGRKKFPYSERLERAGIEMAGVDPAKGRIWNGSWFAELRGDSWRLEAADGAQRIRLELQPHKPPAIHGKNGVSQKSAGEGNASHYYSLTRLRTAGRLETGGETYEVTGASWMDHEFATNQLQPEQVGWDWVSIQMDDGSDWMLFQLRLAGGGRDPHSAGSYVPPDGRAAHLGAEDFQMIPLDHWQSPHSGARYPIRWRVLVPGQKLDLTVSAAMPDQELLTQETTGVIYWEGTVLVQGTRNGTPVQGRGYLEMTGYGSPLQPGLYSAP